MSVRNIFTRRVYAPFDASTASQPRYIHFHELALDSVYFTWLFRVYVVHKFHVREIMSGPMLQFIVVDENGMKMEAFCFGRQVPRFDRLLAEENSYEAIAVKVDKNPNEFRFIGKELERFIINQISQLLMWSVWLYTSAQFNTSTASHVVYR